MDVCIWNTAADSKPADQGPLVSKNQRAATGSFELPPAYIASGAGPAQT